MIGTPFPIHRTWIAGLWLTCSLFPRPLGAQEPLSSRVALAEARLSARLPQPGLGEDFGFQIRSAHGDGLGQTHVRFRQFHRGIRVWGGEWIEHLGAEGTSLAPTDHLFRGVEIAVEPSLGEPEALAVADRHLAPKGPYARPPQVERVVFPLLEHLPRSGLRGPANARDVVPRLQGYILAYHVHAELENEADGVVHRDYLVDAHRGTPLRIWDSLRTQAVEGTGKSQYSASVTLNTNGTTTGYELRDLTRPTVAHPRTGQLGHLTYDLAHGTSDTGTLYTDPDNVWGDGQNYVAGAPTGSDNGQTAAVDAHFGLQATWDLFKHVFDRNGIDGRGTSAYSRVHFYTNYVNAFWSDYCFCMTYGDGNTAAGWKVLTSLDIVGHEVTHGVTAATANLDYFGESGGLNEATSDIFGTLAEFYVGGGGYASGASVIPATGGNWTLAEQVVNPPLRFMYKPSKDGLSKDEWSLDLRQLDVHYSSGPMNRAFYFLSQGATPSGDTATPRLPDGMTGLGNDKAARIWYRALSSYLTQGSGYFTARKASVRSAEDLFGALSPEYVAVQNAFHGINVGVAGDGVKPEDLKPPLVSNVGAAGSSGTVTLRADAVDDPEGTGIGWVEFRVDGLSIGTGQSPTSGSTFTLSLDSTLYRNGAHLLVTEVFDLNGNATRSAPAAFTIANLSDQLIRNPGFEEKLLEWTASSGIWIWDSPPNAHGGRNVAVMGGYGRANSDSVAQGFTLPASTVAADLRFWVRVLTGDTSSANQDQMKVVLRDASNAPLATLVTFTNQDAGSGNFMEGSASLQPYASQALTLSFEYAEDAANYTYFILDDITLKARDASAGVAISVPAPRQVVVKGRTASFTATVTGATDTGVLWSVVEPGGGSIDASGNYTAPDGPGVTHVLASSRAFPSVSTTVEVRVVNLPNLDGVGMVDGLDLGLLALAFGTGDLAADLNGDGIVNDADAELLLAAFGR